MQTFVDSEFIWRIQGTIKAELSMPDTNTVDWTEFADEDKSFEELYDKYKDLVNFDRIDYLFV